MSNTLILTKELILSILTKRAFYSSVPAFSPMEVSVENIHKRLQAEGILNADGSINKVGCSGCKARQFRDVQNNIVDTFVGALIQLQKNDQRGQLNKVKEYLAEVGHPAEEVQVTYSGPATNKEEVTIRF